MGKKTAADLTTQEYDDLLLATIDAIKPLFVKHDGTMLLSIVAELLHRVVRCYPEPYRGQVVAQIVSHIQTTPASNIQ